MKGTIVFDFDGVIHKYSKGWSDGTIYDKPNKNVVEVIDKLRANGYIVDIVSTRSSTMEGAKSIQAWLEKYGIEVDHILSEKPPALVYIDDRSICFDPKDKNLYNEIIEFKPYSKTIQDYKQMSDLELLGLMQLKSRQFSELNKKFDEKPVDPIISIKLLDDWIKSLQKYI